MSSPSSESPERERGPHCGVRQRDPPKSSVESALDDLFEGGNPFVAALLSALFPGLGQLYNRELERGLAFIVGSMLALLSALALVGFVLYPAVWVYSIYDAYTRAERVAPDDGSPPDSS
jgi:TM2 domain-containing membrane protein YozV